jgi:hypothetical protein
LYDFIATFLSFGGDFGVVAVIDSTAAKPTALIPPSTSRREALAALND